MEEATTWRGGVRRMTLSEGQRLRVTGLSLADPAAGSSQLQVTVWAEVGGHETAHVIGTLSSEQPIAPVLPQLELAGGDGEFVLRHDSAASSVRLYGHYLDPPPPNLEDGGEGEPTMRRFLVDIDAEELGDDDDGEAEVECECETVTEEDVVERDDGDNGEDGSDHSDCDEEEEEEEEVQTNKTRDDVEAAGREMSKRRRIAPLKILPDHVFL